MGSAGRVAVVHTERQAEHDDGSAASRDRGNTACEVYAGGG